jgi:hypothetical protein
VTRIRRHVHLCKQISVVPGGVDFTIIHKSLPEADDAQIHDAAGKRHPGSTRGFNAGYG